MVIISEMMRNSLLLKVLVFGIFLLFIVIGIAPIVSSNFLDEKIVATKEMKTVVVSNAGEAVCQRYHTLLASRQLLSSESHGKKGEVLDDLKVMVTTDKKIYKKSEPVEVTISVTNKESEDVTLVFPDSQVADFKVKDIFGNMVYQWSFDKCFLQMLTEVTIPSGETVVFLCDKWYQLNNSDLPVSLGIYQIYGWLPGYPMYNDSVYFGVLRFKVDFVLSKLFDNRKTFDDDFNHVVFCEAI